MTEHDKWSALLRDGHVPFSEGEWDHRKTIDIIVPDAAAGRVTKDHPGAVISLLFIKGRFAGIVKDRPTTTNGP